jgi:hypothetical protein
VPAKASGVGGVSDRGGRKWRRGRNDYRNDYQNDYAWISKSVRGVRGRGGGDS